MIRLRHKAFAATLFLALLGCTPREHIDPSFDRSSQSFTITVTLHDSKASLYAADAKTGRPGNPSRTSFAVWRTSPDGKPTGTCEIHGLTPESVDDSLTKSLGHELVHCVYGAYVPSER